MAGIGTLARQCGGRWRRMKALALGNATLLGSSRPAADTVGKAPPADAWRREMEKAQASMWLGHEVVGAGPLPEGSAPQNAGAPAHANPRLSRDHAQDRDAALVRSRSARSAPLETGESPSGFVAYVAPAPADRSMWSQRLGLQLPPAGPGIGAMAPPAHGAASAPTDTRAAPLHCIATCVAGMRSAAVKVAHSDAAPQGTLMSLPAPRGHVVQDGHRPYSELLPAGPPRVAPSGEAPDATAVRVHCQFTDGGVLVWLGAAAHSGLNVQALAAALQEALMRHAQRLSCLTCNGQVVWQTESLFLSPHEDPTWPSKR